MAAMGSSTVEVGTPNLGAQQLQVPDILRGSIASSLRNGGAPICDRKHPDNGLHTMEDLGGQNKTLEKTLQKPKCLGGQNKTLEKTLQKPKGLGLPMVHRLVHRNYFFRQLLYKIMHREY